ncbi:hypothetical protein CLG96_00160 [Sphingomonas oleivorans]|uniref:Phage tail protein n=2 Tax=Sphingomonas oleivorans TaxID=1735121 RepID=A0A2T5G3C4_9SPHN|nr:hypothetical protein CLG96_00160 [Sphingomonas oleivorans]
MADIATGISATFGGPFHPARVITQSGGGYDDGGSWIPGTVAYRDCRVQVDQVSEAMRGGDGYSEGDMRFLILAATLAGSLDSDARIELLEGPHAGIWIVSSLTRDPAGLYWEGRGRRG